MGRGVHFPALERMVLNMDWSLIITVPVVLLGVIGAVLVAAGAVAYRGSTRMRTRVFAAAAIAAGIALWALLLWITPVAVTSSATPGVISPQVVSNAPPQRAMSPVEGTPGAGEGPNGQPTRGVKKGPGLQSTPLAIEGPSVAVTPAAPPGADPNPYPPGATVAPVPEPATSPRTDEWTDWKGNGYQFRYPPACQVVQRGQLLTVGAAIELTAADPGGLDFVAYVNQLLESQTKAGTWKIDSQKRAKVGEIDALQVDYRFGSTNRFGTAVFIEGKGRVYIWGLTAGGFTCNEPAAFDGIVSSFRLMGSDTPTPSSG